MKKILYPEIRLPLLAAGKRDPLMAFLAHRGGAKRREVPFHLSFEQWWSLWEEHWDQRGQGALEKCMCRKGDQGAYELGNVRIATNKENHHEKILEWRVAHSQRTYRPREYRTPLNKELVSWAKNENPFKKYVEEGEESA
jgi:hypothetical protein